MREKNTARNKTAWLSICMAATPLDNSISHGAYPYFLMWLNVSDIDGRSSINDPTVLQHARNETLDQYDLARFQGRQQLVFGELDIFGGADHQRNVPVCVPRRAFETDQRVGLIVEVCEDQAYVLHESYFQAFRGGTLGMEAKVRTMIM